MIFSNAFLISSARLFLIFNSHFFSHQLRGSEIYFIFCQFEMQQYGDICSLLVMTLCGFLWRSLMRGSILHV